MKPLTPFVRNGRLYVLIPGAGLCRLGSWGWQPV